MLKKLIADVARLKEKVFGDPQAETTITAKLEVDATAVTDLAKAQIELSQAEAELAQAQDELAIARQTISTLTAQVKEKESTIVDLNSKLTESNAKVSKLESTIADPKGQIAEEAGKKAADIVAGQGLPVEKLPGGSNATSADPKAAALKKYGELISAGKSLEAGKFWAENRDLLK